MVMCPRARCAPHAVLCPGLTDLAEYKVGGAEEQQQQQQPGA